MSEERWLNYYITRHEAENAVWHGFFQKISYLITSIALVCSAWVYGLTKLKPELWYAYVCPIIGGILLLFVAWYLFWLIHDRDYQPMQASNDIRKDEKRTDVTKEQFDDWLIGEIANATTDTRNVNSRRSGRLYKAEMFLFFSVVMFIPYVILALL